MRGAASGPPLVRVPPSRRTAPPDAPKPPPSRALPSPELRTADDTDRSSGVRSSVWSGHLASPDLRLPALRTADDAHRSRGVRSWGRAARLGRGQAGTYGNRAGGADVRAIVRAPSWMIVASALVAASGCTSDPAPVPSSSSSTTTTTPTARPTVEAEYGCGPTDATQVTIRGHDVGDRVVVLELVWDGAVSDRTEPMTGPTVGAIVEPNLPREAYDAGTAEVRIVDADDRRDVIARAPVDLRLEGGCG